MNRWLIVAVMGLTVGCAAGVEDPQPEPTPDQAAKQRPAQTLSGEVPENPYDQGVAHSIANELPNLPDVPILPMEKPQPGR